MQNNIIIFLIVIFSLYSRSYAQINLDLKIDTLNNYNNEGKKHGYWIEFLNKRLVPTNKKKKAAYYGICYYENNARIYPNYGSNVTISYQVITNEVEDMKGHPELLNGHYYKIQKGDTIESFFFKDGSLQLIKSYYGKKRMHYYFDYRKKYKGDILSYYLIEYDFDEKIKHSGFFTRIDGRWCFINDNETPTNE